ncbi:basement membrane-specific heparan sulfate proteoglycan core protein-like [Mya arenaria]|uniref:basement membrane-specific heparan sulfate proteoglycan core protein-like n=1 Tax=Mya arenaria TaxID=6604 RepID=UPI0022E66687|nr:basement membrane-specific heparan sulfate proteoglycan core protein-like [Mya arenaria]
MKMDISSILLFYFLANAITGEVQIRLNGYDVKRVPGDNVIKVVEHDSALLKCFTLSTASITWAITKPMIGSTTIHNDTILIPVIQPEDSGDYTCKVVSDMNKNTTKVKNITLEVVYMKSPAISGHLAMFEDETVELSCAVDANPTPQYEWRNDNELTISRGQTLNITLDKSRIRPYNSSFQIKFKCVTIRMLIPSFGSGRRAEGSVRINVTVYRSVKMQGFENGGNYFNVAKGDTVDKVCLALAYPEPQFWWTKSSNTTSEVIIASGQRLVIKNVTVKADGVYTCHASNLVTLKNGKLLTTSDSTDLQVIVFTSQTDLQETASPNCKCTSELLFSRKRDLIIALTIGWGFAIITLVVYICHIRKLNRNTEQNTTEVKSETTAHARGNVETRVPLPHTPDQSSWDRSLESTLPKYTDNSQYFEIHALHGNPVRGNADKGYGRQDTNTCSAEGSSTELKHPSNDAGPQTGRLPADSHVYDYLDINSSEGSETELKQL